MDETYGHFQQPMAEMMENGPPERRRRRHRKHVEYREAETQREEQMTSSTGVPSPYFADAVAIHEGNGNNRYNDKEDMEQLRSTGARRVDSDEPERGRKEENDDHRVQDPLGVLGRFIRVYWPLDEAWYRGQVTEYDPHQDFHFVLYDDGDKKWYSLPTRLFIVEKNYGEEVVGRDFLILVSQNRWENATVISYDPCTERHKIRIRGKLKEVDLDEYPILWIANPQEFLTVDHNSAAIDLSQHPEHSCFDTVYSPLPQHGNVETEPQVLELADCVYDLHSGATPVDRLQRLFSTVRDRPLHWQFILGRRVYTLDKRRSDINCGVIVKYDEQEHSLKIVYDHGTSWHKACEIDFAFEGDTNYGTMAVSGTELRGVSICNRRNGLVGLENLQNTCYFNSILQCLAHICPLSKFMLSGLPFRANLNLKRKFGLDGRFAEAFAALLWHMWFGKQTCIAPVWIKSLLTEKDNSFHGVGQQDAHEALMNVIDALHEDMARTFKVPVKTIDAHNVVAFSVDAQPATCSRYSGDSVDSHQIADIKDQRQIPLPNERQLYQFVMDIPSLQIPGAEIELETSIIKQMFFLYTVVERQWDVIEMRDGREKTKAVSAKPKPRSKSKLREWVRKIFRRDKSSKTNELRSLPSTDAEKYSKSKTREAVILSDEDLLSSELQLGPDDGELLPPLPVCSAVQPTEFSRYFDPVLYSLCPADTSRHPTRQVIEIDYKGTDLRNMETLIDCLRAYFSPHISYKGATKDDESNEKYGLAKTWLLPPLPPVLIVQLNRFQCAPPSVDSSEFSSGQWRLLPARSLNETLGDYISASNYEECSTPEEGTSSDMPSEGGPSTDEANSGYGEAASQQQAGQLLPKKLSQPISFPIDGLDLSEFVACSAVRKAAWAKRMRNRLKQKGSTSMQKKNKNEGSPFDTCPIQVPDRELRQDETLYDCFGVVCHRGRMEGGHYIAYIRYGATAHLNQTNFLAPGWLKHGSSFGANVGFPVDLIESIGQGRPDGIRRSGSISDSIADEELYGKWFLLDDSYVCEVDESEVLKQRTRSSAYLLFYARHST